MTLPPQLLAPAPDDAGAETADRYDWQALTAAVDCLARIADEMARNSEDAGRIKLICEYQEDYVLCVGEAIELVSAKHRELSRGGWTYAALFSDGGLTHLFQRWTLIDEMSSVRLVTNAALSGPEAIKFSQLCERLRLMGIGPLDELTWIQLELISKRIYESLRAEDRLCLWTAEDGIHSDDFASVVRRFMSELTLDCGRPPRHILPSAAISMYMIPFLVALGRHVDHAEAAWEIVCSLFRQRMRGHGSPLTEGLVTVIRNIHGLTEEQRHEHRIADRIISVHDILEAIYLAETVGFSPVGRGRTLAPTRLALKLINAGCQETTINAAEAVARRWRDHESSLVLAGPGTSVQIQRAKTHALLLAADIHESAAAGAEKSDYGPRMWRDMREALSAEAFDDQTLILDDDLALGLACNLASQCQIWFSPNFDIIQARAVFPERLLQPASTGDVPDA